MVEARDSEIEFAAQAELACTTNHANGIYNDNGSSAHAQAPLTTPEKTTNGRQHRLQQVHADKGDGYAADHELLDVKSLSRNALREIVLSNGGSKKSSSLKDKYFTLQAVEVKQFQK